MTAQQDLVRWSLRSVFKIRTNWFSNPLFKVITLTSVINASIYFAAITLTKEHAAPVSEVMFSVDHFEDNGWAILEVGTEAAAIIDFPRTLLPEGTKEGSVLVFQRFESGAVYIKFDHEEKERRLNHVKQLRNNIKKAPSGDIDL